MKKVPLWCRHPKGLLDIVKESWETKPSFHLSIIYHVAQDQIQPIIYPNSGLQTQPLKTPQDQAPDLRQQGLFGCSTLSLEHSPQQHPTGDHPAIIQTGP